MRQQKVTRFLGQLLLIAALAQVAVLDMAQWVRLQLNQGAVKNCERDARFANDYPF
jgi:hypothetical protein